jgi:hypothetical protein
MGQDSFIPFEIISVADLKCLPPNEFALLSVEQLRALTKEHMSALSDAQLEQMTDEKLTLAWSMEHLNALSTDQGVCLGKALYIDDGAFG